MATFRIPLSDGREFEVDANSQEEAIAKLQAQLDAQNQVTTSPGGDTVLGASIPEDPAGVGVLREFAGQGLLLQAGDEVEAGLSAFFKNLKGKETDFDTELKRVRAEIDFFREQNPTTAAIAQGGGALAGAFIPGRSVVAGLTLGSRVARGAAAGAGVGGVAGFLGGEGVTDRVTEGVTGAAIGAPFGALGGALSVSGRKVDVPELEEIKSVASQAFEFIENAGFSVGDTATRRLNRTLRDTFSKTGSTGRIVATINRKENPLSFNLLGDINKATRRGELDIVEIREWRRRAREIASDQAGSSDGTKASLILDDIDNFFMRLHPSDLAGGSARELKNVQRILPLANKAWSQFKKGEVIAETIHRAGLSASAFKGSGFENALRNEFRALAKNKKRIRPFNQKEQAAIENVVEGGPAGNFFRRLGTFAPTGGGGQAATAAGVAALGPKALLIPATTGSARALATGATAGRANLASELVRSGGTRRILGSGGLFPASAALLPAQSETTRESARGLGRSFIGLR